MRGRGDGQGRGKDRGVRDNGGRGGGRGHVRAGFAQSRGTGKVCLVQTDGFMTTSSVLVARSWVTTLGSVLQLQPAFGPDVR